VRRAVIRRRRTAPRRQRPAPRSWQQGRRRSRRSRGASPRRSLPKISPSVALVVTARGRFRCGRGRRRPCPARRPAGRRTARPPWSTAVRSGSSRRRPASPAHGR
ncbi:MAG: hypothetical protein ACK55I_22445, partial [bacterium]